MVLYNYNLQEIFFNQFLEDWVVSNQKENNNSFQPIGNYFRNRNFQPMRKVSIVFNQ